MVDESVPGDRAWSAAISRSTRAEWLGMGAILAVLLASIVPVVMPIASIGFVWERSHQEGWNAYLAVRAAAGETLYSGDAARVVSYPFLSFYLVAWLKPLFGDVLIVGRLLNVVGLAGVVVCSAMIVRRLGGQRGAMIFAAAAVLGFVHIQAAGWIGHDEPQLLAEALALGGLLCYVSGAPTFRRLALCALLCCASGFVKPITAAVPVAITIDLAWRNWRACAIWCLCGAGALLIFAGLSYAIAGGDFISEVLAPRAYYWGRVWYHAKKFARDLKWPLLASVIYLCQRRSWANATILGVVFIVSLCFGMFASGGEGVSYNALLEPAVVMGMLLALALEPWRIRLERFRVGRLVSVWLPIIVALPVFTKLQAASLPSNWGRAWQFYEQRQSEFLQATEFLAGVPGDALCDNLLLCLEAGKPLIVEPFTARAMIVAKRLDESKLVGLVEGQRFGAIQLPDLIFPYPDEPDRFSDALTRIPRFTEPMLQAIARFYVPTQRIGNVVFYFPKSMDMTGPGSSATD